VTNGSDGEVVLLQRQVCDRIATTQRQRTDRGSTATCESRFSTTGITYTMSCVATTRSVMCSCSGSAGVRSLSAPHARVLIAAPHVQQHLGRPLPPVDASPFASSRGARSQRAGKHTPNFFPCQLPITVSDLALAKSFGRSPAPPVSPQCRRITLLNNYIYYK
jgi:hypothetical protein